MTIYGKCYVPRTKQELVKFLLPRLNAWNKAFLKAMPKKQLYAIYFKVRGDV